MSRLGSRPASAGGVINPFLLRHVRPGSTVLDVGCGYGESALLIARRVPRVTVEAVDVDAPSVHRANRRFRRAPANAALRCRQADVTELVKLFGRRRFDYAVSNNSFHEFWGPIRALRQIRAVLKPGGTLLLAELTPSAGEAVDDCSRHSRGKLVELVQHAGFAVRSAITRHPGIILIRALR